jgi:hypothetical protein
MRQVKRLGWEIFAVDLLVVLETHASDRALISAAFLSIWTTTEDLG